MDVTHKFAPGTRAVAEQVNQNFDDVKSAIDPLENSIIDIEAQLDGGVVLPDGTVPFTRLQSYATYVVSNATNATPIVITAVGHPFLTGDKVQISGVGGNTAANGIFTITKTGADTFSLNDSVGSGAFTTNGAAVIYPSSSFDLVNKRYVDYSGCRLKRSSAQATSTGVSAPVQWNVEDFDTNGFHSISTDNTRITIPAGITKVKLTTGIAWDSNNTGSRSVRINKNTSTIIAFDQRLASTTSGTTVSTGVIAVVPTDYFEVYVNQSSGGNLNIDGGNEYTFFSLEVVE